VRASLYNVKRVDLYNWQLKHGTIDWIKQAFCTWQVDKFADHLNARAKLFCVVSIDGGSMDAFSQVS